MRTVVVAAISGAILGAGQRIFIIAALVITTERLFDIAITIGFGVGVTIPCFDTPTAIPFAVAPCGVPLVDAACMARPIETGFLAAITTSRRYDGEGDGQPKAVRNPFIQLWHPMLLPRAVGSCLGQKLLLDPGQDIEIET